MKKVHFTLPRHDYKRELVKREEFYDWNGVVSWIQTCLFSVKELHNLQFIGWCIIRDGPYIANERYIETMIS